MMSPDSQHKRLTFKKKERLKSRSTIQALFDTNQNLRNYPFKLVWMVVPSSDASLVKAGVSVSKRNHRSAVTRNFIKRRMRECYRTNKSELYQSLEGKNVELSFMLIYLSSEIVPFTEFEQKIKQLLFRLSEKVKTNDFL
ncbi:MAG: ribonuclease P protein component [Salinivirgaceae bacterium]